MVNLEYLPQASRPVYEPEEPQVPERTAWDYIRDAVEVGLFFAAGAAWGMMASVVYTIGGR